MFLRTILSCVALALLCACGNTDRSIVQRIEYTSPHGERFELVRTDNSLLALRPVAANTQPTEVQREIWRLVIPYPDPDGPAPLGETEYRINVIGHPRIAEITVGGEQYQMFAQAATFNEDDGLIFATGAVF